MDRSQGADHCKGFLEWCEQQLGMYIFYREKVLYLIFILYSLFKWWQLSWQFSNSYTVAEAGSSVKSSVFVSSTVNPTVFQISGAKLDNDNFGTTKVITTLISNKILPAPSVGVPGVTNVDHAAIYLLFTSPEVSVSSKTLGNLGVEFNGNTWKNRSAAYFRLSWH
jgi:hypothetical protein